MLNIKFSELDDKRKKPKCNRVLGSKQIYFDNPQVAPNNAILDELDSFADAITQDTTPEVTLTQGAEALRVAMMIIDNFKIL